MNKIRKEDAPAGWASWPVLFFQETAFLGDARAGRQSRELKQDTWRTDGTRLVLVRITGYGVREQTDYYLGECASEPYTADTLPRPESPPDTSPNAP